MRITCPTCDTSYAIADDKIGAKGRSVRCARCGTQWQIALPEPDDDLHDSLTEAAGPDARGWDEPPIAPRPAVRAPEPEAKPSVADFTAADAETVIAEPVEPSSLGDRPSLTADVASLREPVEAALNRRNAAAAKKKIDVETAAMRKKARAQTRQIEWRIRMMKLRPAIGAIFMAGALLVVTGAIVLRGPIVALSPGLASLYRKLGFDVNLRGLAFEDLQTFREMENAQPVLVIEGSIANVAGQSQAVPAIRLALRGEDSQEIYAWTVDPKTTSLPQGETTRFRTKIVAPPVQAADIQLRFIERRNRQAVLP